MFIFYLDPSGICEIGHWWLTWTRKVVGEAIGALQMTVWRALDSCDGQKLHLCAWGTFQKWCLPSSCPEDCQSIGKIERVASTNKWWMLEGESHSLSASWRLSVWCTLKALAIVTAWEHIHHHLPSCLLSLPQPVPGVLKCLLTTLNQGTQVSYKTQTRSGHGGTGLYSQHQGGRGRRISMNSRPTWST